MLIGSGDIIVNAWKNLRANFAKYSELAIWLTLLGVAEWALDILFKGAFADKTERAVVLALAKAPIYLAKIVVWTAMIDIAAKTVQRQSAQVRGALGNGLHVLIPLIWASILYAAVIFGGTLLLVIPGIYFMVRYKYAATFVIVDDMRGWKAFIASADVVRGRWGSTLWRSAVPVMFFSVAAGLAANLLHLVLGSVLGDPGLFFGNVSSFAELPAGYSLVANIATDIVAGYTVTLLFCSDVLLWLSLKQETAKQLPA